MPIFTKKADDFEPIPQGTHNAVCCDVVFKPNQETRFGIRDKIQLRFQLLDAHKTTGERHIAYFTATASSAKKSALWTMLESWIDPVPVAQRHTYDLENLIGQGCQLIIVHTQAEGRIYSNVKLILPLIDPKVDLRIEDYVREIHRNRDQAA